MTRKHFQLIADTLAGLNWMDVESYRRVCENFADVLAGTNSNFDRERFLTACGL